MTRQILDGIQRLQEHLLELGLARSVLGLPAPRMLAVTSPTSASSEPSSVFERMIVEPEIHGVCADLFVSGHYNLAVAEAFKAVEKLVARLVPHVTQNGTTLMGQAFAPAAPHLTWSAMVTLSETDEQKGYHRLFSGAMLGIRNPATHEFNWIEEPEAALELIIFAQHLVRKAKAASGGNGKASSPNSA